MNYLPPYVLILFFVAFWCAIETILSILGGWHKLAKRFPSPPYLSGKLFRFSSASLGFGLPVNYGSCLYVRVSEAGISLSTLFIFRFMHPPIFIPWAEIISCQKGWFLFWPGVELRLKDSSSRVVLRGWTGSAALNQWQQRHEMPIKVV